MDRETALKAMAIIDKMDYNKSIYENLQIQKDKIEIKIDDYFIHIPSNVISSQLLDYFNNEIKLLAHELKEL